MVCMLLSVDDADGMLCYVVLCCVMLCYDHDDDVFGSFPSSM